MVDFGMSSFLVDIPHQSCRLSFPGQRFVCWHLHNSTSILWSTSWTACLLFSFYTSGHCILICVFRLSSAVSVKLGLGILIDILSPVHDRHYAGKILFLHWYQCEFFCTEGNNRSLWESPRARGRAMDVLCRSPSTWCRPAYNQTVNVCDFSSQQPYNP